MASGTLSSASLDRYSSVALAGVATEYVRFGQAEGGLNDIQQLDGLLRALQARFEAGYSPCILLDGTLQLLRCVLRLIFLRMTLLMAHQNSSASSEAGVRHGTLQMKPLPQPVIKLCAMHIN